MDPLLLFDDDDDIEVFELVEFGIPRQIYERADYFHTMDDTTFRRRFRLTKEVVLDILTRIEERLEVPYNLNNSVSPINQLLTTLRLFSTGGHLDAVADFARMHLSTVSRIVPRVSEAIAHLRPNYIQMPRNPDAIRSTQHEFF